MRIKITQVYYADADTDEFQMVLKAIEDCNTPVIFDSLGIDVEYPDEADVEWV